MKKNFIYFACMTFVILTSVFMQASAQRDAANGFSLPVHSPVKVMVVFAQIDDANCNYDFSSDSWPYGELPALADTIFDHEMYPAGQQNGPQAYLSKYYYEASHGKNYVTGDVLNTLITVPCDDIPQANFWSYSYVRSQLDSIFKHHDSVGTSPFIHGSSFEDFDNYTIPPYTWTQASNFAGLPKNAEPDDRIDALMIMWNAHPSLGVDSSGNPNRGPAGEALLPRSSALNHDFGPFIGANNNASFGIAGASIGRLEFIIQEYMHAMYGGNLWHSAGGAGNHTFAVRPRSYGLTAQHQTMFAVSGWDRHHLSWKNPGKTYVTSALDANDSYNEVPTDSFNINDHPNGGTFVLRDHVPTGDAIQIKLPLIEWQEAGDVKNQYLWLENRQMKAHMDAWYTSDCADNNDGQFLRGTPGMYAYIQSGKDVREGAYSDIWSGSMTHPNGLASWKKPLSAEGQWDYEYRHEKSGACGYPDGGCCWDNYVLPMDKHHENTLPNPFTGHQDQYQAQDYGQTGQLHDDSPDPSLSLAQIHPDNPDSVFYPWQGSGDWHDAFSFATGSTELSLSTNPAPVPAYTYTSTNSDYFGPTSETRQDTFSYENRTIHLNGLKIEILEENYQPGTFGDGAIKLRIDWDHYEVNQDVRWTGNIRLSPHDFDISKPSLELGAGKKIHLDQGHSPRKHYAREFLPYQGESFAKPTVFTAEEDAIIRLKENSQFFVDNNSTLELQDGAEMIIEDGAGLEVDNGSEVIVHPGADITIKDDGYIEVMDAGKLTLKEGMNLTLEDLESRLTLKGLMELSGEDKDFTLEGDGYFQVYPSELVAGGEGVSFYLEGNDSTHRRMMVSGDWDLPKDHDSTSLAWIYKAHLLHDEITSIEGIDLSDIKVDYENNSGIDIEIPFSFNSVSFFSGDGTVHYGISLYNQEETELNYLHFKDCLECVTSTRQDANETLEIRDSYFEYIETALNLYHDGIHVTNTIFENVENVFKGIGMTGKTILTNVLVEDVNGISSYYGSSGSQLTLESNLWHDVQAGYDKVIEIEETMGTFSCNEFYAADEHLGSMIFGGQNAIVNLDSIFSPDGYNNIFEDFQNAVGLTAAQYIYLDRGYNDFSQNQYSIYGTFERSNYLDYTDNNEEHIIGHLNFWDPSGTSNFHGSYDVSYTNPVNPKPGNSFDISFIDSMPLSVRLECEESYSGGSVNWGNDDLSKNCCETYTSEIAGDDIKINEGFTTATDTSDIGDDHEDDGDGGDNGDDGEDDNGDNGDDDNGDNGDDSGCEKDDKTNNEIAMDLLYEILMYEDYNYLYSTRWYLWQSYQYKKIILMDAYNNRDICRSYYIDDEINPYLDMFLQVNQNRRNNLDVDVNPDYSEKFMLAMDEVQFLRLFNQYDKAMSELNNIRTWAHDSHVWYVDHWDCMISTEQSFENEEIEPQEFHEELSLCQVERPDPETPQSSQDMPSAIEHDQEKEPDMIIHPNPHAEEAKISLSNLSSEPKGEIFIYDNLGREILHLDELKSSGVMISKEETGEGYFIVTYKEQNKPLITKPLIVY